MAQLNLECKHFCGLSHRFTFDLSYDLTTAGNPLVCSESRFKCRNGHCVDRSFLCNGQDNCQDNSDEELCLTTAGKAYIYTRVSFFDMVLIKCK